MVPVTVRAQAIALEMSRFHKTRQQTRTKSLSRASPNKLRAAHQGEGEPKNAQEEEGTASPESTISTESNEVGKSRSTSISVANSFSAHDRTTSTISAQPSMLNHLPPHLLEGQLASLKLELNKAGELTAKPLEERIGHRRGGAAAPEGSSLYSLPGRVW